MKITGWIGFKLQIFADWITEDLWEIKEAWYRLRYPQRRVYLVLQHANLLTFVRYGSLSRREAEKHAERLREDTPDNPTEGVNYHQTFLRPVMLDETVVRCIASDEIYRRDLNEYPDDE